MSGTLPGDPSERSEFASEISDAIAEARCLIKQCAEPRPVGDSVKAAIGRAARRLGWSYSRAKDVWYGGARRIDVAEMDRLRSSAEDQKNNEAIADEIDRLRARLSRLERQLDRRGGARSVGAHLVRQDPHFAGSRVR
jgi:hypothetical protein